MTKHTRARGTGTVRPNGYIAHYINGKIKFAHVLVAEKALGHPLPKGAQIHHIDENPANNTPENLVICPSQSYHKLLHLRMRARAAGVPLDWRECIFCRAHDDTIHMKYNEGWAHPECRNRYNRERRAKLRK